MAGAAGAVLFMVGAATAPADRSTPTATSSTSGTTTTVSSTAPTITAPTTTEQTTTALATTTVPATTVTAPPVTTAPKTITLTPTSPPRTSGHAPTVKLGPVTGVRERSLASGCPVAAVVLLLPHRAPLVLGQVAAAPSDQVSIATLVYRASGGVVTASNATMIERACTPHGPADARATVSSLSLLDGAVTAAHVTLSRQGQVAATVTQASVDRKRVSLSPGARTNVPGVGYLTTGPNIREPVSQDVVAAAALALHLTSAHAGLPAGTVILVAAIGLPLALPGTTTTQAPGRRPNRRPRTRR